MTVDMNQNVPAVPEENLPDVKISGSGQIAGGNYGVVHISGSGHYSGDIRCREVHASGSLKGEGSITVSEEFHVSGSFKGVGDLTASEVHISGSAAVGGAVSCREELHTSGSVRCQSITAKNIHVSGRVETAGDVEGDEVRISGSGTIGGLLNAENIEIKASDGLAAGSRLLIGSIGGSKVRVTISGAGGFFRRVIGRNPRSVPFVVTETIEGDEIDIDSVSALRVSGQDVVIGSGCEIKSVEYSGSLIIEEGAVVGEQRKI